ncbi:MAG: hypothetical protein KGD59_15780 [Candidatus Heimdallarchaeota archaeon]|nr:hypothetical protein [Candidatus Heimdallarchaeota archaeon]MBY8996010.1 hypothetical protein [Candidatus Heimdallarchaeota archaeon]
MFDRLLGFRTIQRQVEEKLVQLSFIPSKYFEALYVESSTKITCHTCDICEVEEVTVRAELLRLMKQGEVDTKVELEKFQLFERINSVSVKSKEIRVLMNQYFEELEKKNYDQLVRFLKEASYAGKLMHYSVKGLYNDYDTALERVEELIAVSKKLIGNLVSFRFYDQDDDGTLDYSFEGPEVLIGNAIRDSLQGMIFVGEKVAHIVQTFSYNHKVVEVDEEKLLEKAEKEEKKKKKREQRKSKREKSKKKKE